VFSNVFCQASNQLVGHGGYVHHSKISTAVDVMFKQNVCALWQSKMNCDGNGSVKLPRKMSIVSIHREDIGYFAYRRVGILHDRVT
jgi:hypothetical protein